eukprot:TRINITY_DN732_c0_g1_i1.p1 TRINITY_DN732_c0_g1~~TRINITY_DN732_c0_g1_i1.p1  ORF type:complete len:334 (-),score=38.52 TRINITY_DN732_c0_g1_i1:97-1098(-)
MAINSADTIFFLKADLRSYLEEENNDLQDDKGKAIFETYFSTETSLVPLQLQQEIQSFVQERSSSPPSPSHYDTQHALIKSIQKEIIDILRTFPLEDFVRGSVTAAIYMKRCTPGGQGKIPNELFDRLILSMDSSAPGWKARSHGSCQTFKKSTEEHVYLLETVLVKAPVELAIRLYKDQIKLQDCLASYKSREQLEQIGPDASIHYLTLKKSFYQTKRLDAVMFYGGKHLEDGSYLELMTTVEHPRAPLNDTKKIARMVMEYGGLHIRPVGENQTSISKLLVFSTNSQSGLKDSSGQMSQMREFMEKIAADERYVKNPEIAKDNETILMIFS